MWIWLFWHQLFRRMQITIIWCKMLSDVWQLLTMSSYIWLHTNHRNIKWINHLNYIFFSIVPILFELFWRNWTCLNLMRYSAHKPRSILSCKGKNPFLLITKYIYVMFATYILICKRIWTFTLVFALARKS